MSKATDKKRDEERNPSLPSKTFCSGCGTCVASCPVGALSLSFDSEGFPYPHLIGGQCISCGKCSRVCPVLHPPSPVPPVACFAARSTIPTIRTKSSSGGVFAVFAEKVLSDGGLVYGATMDFPECTVRHVGIRSKEDIYRLQGSKYVQGNASDRFGEIRTSLRNGVSVLFSGLPCQTAALVSFLGGTPDNLLLVDLICHGIPSPSVFLQLRNDILKSSSGSRIINHVFKDKRRGWRRTSSTWLIESSSGVIQKEEGLFLRAFTSDLFSRPSCHHCHFRNHSSASDITIGDFWGPEGAIPDWDDESGISAVLVHTDKGRAFFDSVSGQSLLARPASLSTVVSGNSSLVRSWPPSRCRGLFFFLRRWLPFRSSARISLGLAWILSLPGRFRLAELKQFLKRFQGRKSSPP